MKTFRKGLLAACAAALAIPWVAEAIVIDNGIPRGQVGHFSADVASGGTASSVAYTALLPGGAVITSNIVFAYYVVDNARDVDGFGGSGFLLSGSAPALDGFGAVTSTGVFPSSGGEAIGWRATSTIPPGGQQLFTAYDFTTACAGGGACGSPRVGDLRVFQYVDADVGQAVLRVQDDGTPSVRLETIDQTPGVRYGASITGAFLSGFNIASGAADRYNNIVLSIVGNGQAVAGPNPGIIIKNLGDGFEHPDLGFVYGPADIVSVLAWDAEPSTTQAIVNTALAIVPPPPGPPVDSDFDGVIDPLDLCPGTDIISLEEDGGSIDPNGCPAPPILNRTDVPCSNAACRVKVMGAALLERRFGPSGRLFEEVACHP